MQDIRCIENTVLGKNALCKYVFMNCFLERRYDHAEK